MIEGGFYLKARRIQEAEIMHAPPHVREIWDWLLMKAMFSDGKSLQRGQVITTYNEMRQALSWNIGWRIMRYSRDDCEKAMKWLRKADMVTTMKTTRGIIVSIKKYDYYQNPKNYESHTENHRRATGEPHNLHTIDKNVKKEKKERKPGGRKTPPGRPAFFPATQIKDRPELTIPYSKERSAFVVQQSEPYRLANYLFRQITEHNGKSKYLSCTHQEKEKIIERWSKDIELLLRKDLAKLNGNKFQTVGEVIDWATKHSFWSSNILSGANLRDKWDKLTKQMSERRA